MFPKQIFFLLAIFFAVMANGAEKEWFDFNTGLEKASKENKHVLIDFYADWCYWCKVMDEKTFQDKRVEKKLFKDFIPVRLDAEDKAATVRFRGQTFTNPELTQAFGITGFPSLVFLDAETQLITKIPGYVPAEEFSLILDYIKLKCYETTVSFDDFKKKGGCEEKKKIKKQ